MSSNNSVVEFNYSQSRTINRKLEFSESEGEGEIKNHFLYVLLKDLPANLPSTPNPRKPDLNAKPCKAMRETLATEPEYFTDLNRGLTLVAEKVHFPNQKDEGHKVIVDFGLDEDGNPKGGLVDGGHTYAVLKAEKNSDSPLGDLPVFVNIVEGAEGFASKLARARNTSVQVAEKSIANLDNEFEGIRSVLGDYKDRVIYFENENLDSDTAVFPVEELIALMTTMNRDLYNTDAQPTVAYTGVSSCFNKWLAKQNRPSYEKLYPILRSVVELYEYLYSNFETYAKQAGVGHFGNINGVEKYRGKGDKRKLVKITLPFTGKTVSYKLSKGFSLPVFAALRFLLEEEGGTFKWGAIDPKSFLDKHGAKLVGKVLEAHTKEYGSNPNKTGKSKVLWQNVANAVVIDSLEEKLSRKV